MQIDGGSPEQPIQVFPQNTQDPPFGVNKTTEQNTPINYSFGDPDKPPLEKKLDSLNDDEIDGIGRQVEEEFSRCMSARLFQENIWIRAHQNCKGVYDPDTDFNNGNSRAFVQVTRPKVSNAHSRLVEIVLPPGDNAWSIDATKDPFIPELLTKLLATNTPEEDIRKQIQIKAEKAADIMTRKVSTQLEETKWSAIFPECGLHMCMYGTGVMGAPFAVPTYQNPEASKRNTDPLLLKRWKKIIGLSEMEEKGYVDEFRPQLEVYSPFEIFPDPSSKRIEDCSFVIVRKVLNRSQIMDLCKIEGFKTDVITECLAHSRNGDWTPMRWESVINLTNQQYFMTVPDGRFVIKVRWGWLSGEELKKAGIDIPDKQLNEQVMCQCWVMGGRVIFLQTSDLYRDRLPFYFIPYNLVPHSIWGIGLAEMMQDSQDIINAAERSKCDDMALCCRPQAIVHTDMLAPGETAIDVSPGKIWRVKDSEYSTGRKPVEFFNPPNILNELRAVQQDAMMLADEQTNIPKNLQGMGGEGVHNRTSSGAQLQFNNALTPMKIVAGNLDTYLISPLINDLIRFNLKYSKDPEIVGDFKVSAKGVSGMMARDVANQKLTNLLATVVQNPEAAQRVDWNRVAELNLRGSGLTDEHVFFTEAEQQKRIEQQQQQQAIAQAAQTQLQGHIEQQQKERASTSPQDQLLQAMGSVPDSCMYLKLSLIKKVLENSGFIDKQMEDAIQIELEIQKVIDEDRIHSLGSNAATRELGPIELHQMAHKERLLNGPK